jgi:4,5:9,10-diseco-3-hydroxy-5,9,17-trioxoandrosta-1(10),2-diene-4-oate hydrolase
MQARVITVDGLRVRLLEVAPAEERDDPVLLIHGLGGWAENWAPVMPAIAASGRRAIAVDLPGFGESERARDPRYFDVEAPFYGRFFISLLDALEIGSAHIAGQSFGGAVAFMSAIWSPDRVRSLALVAPGGIGRTLPPGFRFLVLPLMEHIARWRRSPTLTRAILYSCFNDPARCPDEVLAEAIRYGETSSDELIRVLRAGVSFRTGIHERMRRSWLERSARYTGPVLVVWGREDRLLPASLAEELRAIAPRAEVRIIPSCGHLVMIERPDEFNETFIPFLDRAAAPVMRN